MLFLFRIFFSSREAIDESSLVGASLPLAYFEYYMLRMYTPASLTIIKSVLRMYPSKSFAQPYILRVSKGVSKNPRILAYELTLIYLIFLFLRT